MVEDYLEGNRVIVLVRAPWRNRAQRKYNRYKEIYYKQLTQAVMEAEKSRPRRADGIVPVWICRPENQESRWYRFSPSLSPKVGENQGLAERQAEKEFFITQFFILFRPSTDWMRPTTLGRVICFIQPTYSNVSLMQKYPHEHTKNNVEPNILALCGLVKLTHKFTHHFGPTFTESFPSITILVVIRSGSINKSLLP